MLFSDNKTTPESYTLSLHDALPISQACSDRIADGGIEARNLAPDRAAIGRRGRRWARAELRMSAWNERARHGQRGGRSEEHTSELQSRFDLVCRLLLEKKKKTIKMK